MSLFPAIAALFVLVSSPDPSASASRAKGLYAEGRYKEAAELFDRLWEESGASKYLYNAAASHEASGGDVVALVDYLHYLRLDEVDLDEWREVRARVGRLQARLVPVNVILEPSALRGMTTLVAQRSDGASTVRVDLGWLVASSGAADTLHLTPGAWTLQVEIRPPAAEHYEPGREALVYVPLPGEEAVGAAARLTARPVESALTVSLGPPEAMRRGVEIELYDRLNVEPPVVKRTREAEVTISLRSGPWRYVLRPRKLGAEAVSGEVDVSRSMQMLERLDLSAGDAHATLVSQGPPGVDRRRLWVLGGGLAGASVLLVAGAAMVGAANKAIPVQDDMFPATKECRKEALCPSFQVGIGGAGVLGASFGIGMAVIAGLMPLKRRMWLAELGVGGALSIGGAIWNVTAYAALRALMPPPEEVMWEERVAEYQRQGFVSAGVLGVGIGMMTGAGFALIVSQRRRVRVTGGPANGVSLIREF